MGVHSINLFDQEYPLDTISPSGDNIRSSGRLGDGGQGDIPFGYKIPIRPFGVQAGMIFVPRIEKKRIEPGEFFRRRERRWVFVAWLILMTTNIKHLF